MTAMARACGLSCDPHGGEHLPVAVEHDEVTELPGPLSQALMRIEHRLDSLGERIDSYHRDLMDMKLQPKREHSRENNRLSTQTPPDDEGSQKRNSVTSNVSQESKDSNVQNLRTTRTSATASSTRSKNNRKAFQLKGNDVQIDLRNTKKLFENDEDEDDPPPALRLVKRRKMDYVWEFLDDPESSRGAWSVSISLKVLVMLCVVLSFLQTTPAPLVDNMVAAILEACFDAIFLVEFLLRFISAPSKWSYLLDPLNWPDLLSASGLPLRAVAGFQLGPSSSREVLDVFLLFFLPLVRFLKLLRYFEIFRLLSEAMYKTVEALPFLSYLAAILCLSAGTGLFLVEDRNTIPTMSHSLWLSIVTMTTVGYGDFFPRSAAGYVIASVLTFVSMLFSALPVGIIGHEFMNCWRSRSQVLLITRLRKNFDKWGYTSQDVRVLFEHVDEDGNGTLNLAEFLELIHQMRVGISFDNAFRIFTIFDDDANDSLDYNEFLKHIFPKEYVRTQLTRCDRRSKAKTAKAMGQLGQLARGVS